MSYTDAFEALFKSISTNWAFNDIPEKKVDWQALYKGDPAACGRCRQKQGCGGFWTAPCMNFILSIPDGHSGIGGKLEDQAFASAVAAGYGFSMAALDDGKYTVIFVTPGTPAEAAGLKVGAEITKFNDSLLPTR